eukprot:gnl/MRDRNA2_/MRDRNA2_65149_c0_seq2.p1 gnl/MRDRNA2_/MRDRNA2_65149_c0~~gnl/MRDRNA2_/MRDRNA2_65149_c0_seq2.p1  ORF type:complete len:285 (+),score=43.30 gnl/MRDRNA2_/MRDRNA2_65149_c0_seq2:610-1464(+)
MFDQDFEDPDGFMDELHCQQTQEPTQYTEEDLVKFRDSIPLDYYGMPTSIGSIGHEKEGCSPCLFAFSKDGCQNGILCNFCHFQHKRKTKPRPCKGKRDRYRKLVTKMESIITQNPWNWEVMETLPPSIVGNPSLRHKLMSKLNAFAENAKTAQSQQTQIVNSSPNMISDIAGTAPPGSFDHSAMQRAPTVIQPPQGSFDHSGMQKVPTVIQPPGAMMNQPCPVKYGQPLNYPIMQSSDGMMNQQITVPPPAHPQPYSYNSNITNPGNGTMIPDKPFGVWHVNQ